MDINQLEVLVTVARERSFSRAAQVLNRTQPAVSQAIRRLEAEIGQELFDRSSKDGTPTQQGEILIGYARQILNLRNSAETAIREVQNLHAGKVTISANEHTVFCILPIVAEFGRRHPLVKIEVRRGVASRIPKEITAREVELGVISFTPSDASLRCLPVMRDELVLIVNADHPFRGRGSVSIKDLGGQALIAHNAPSPYRQKVLENFAQFDTPLNISIELPSLEAIKRLVETGPGVALIPRLSAEAEIAAGRLFAVGVREMKLERNLNIIYKKNAALSNAATAFLAASAEYASRHFENK